MRQSITALLLMLCSLGAHAAVTGRVVDDEGKPVAGARIRARALETPEQLFARLLSSDPMPAFIASAESGEGGAFRIETKGNGVVDLFIDAPGRQYLAVEVADGDDAGTFVLAKRAMARGRVTAGGRGVAGAVVLAGRTYVTRTDAEGNYEVPDSAQRMNRLIVVHPDYAIVTRALRATPEAAPSYDQALDRGFVIRGRVVDAADSPVAGAVVRASGWPLAKSGEDGSFEIAHAPGEKPILFAREGNRVGSLVTSRGKPPYVIRLVPAATLQGSVRNRKNEDPIAGARVSVSADFDAAWWPVAVTDAKGDFSIDAIEPGVHRIMANHPLFFPQPSPEASFAEGARMNRTLYGTPLARITGRVIDEDKRPLFDVRLSMALGPYTTTTAPDGTFSLRFPSTFGPTRTHSVMFSKASYAPVIYGPMSVEEGETKSGVEIRMPRGIAFEIRLIDKDGKPIPNEPVMIMRRIDPSSRFSSVSLPCIKPEDCRTNAEGKLTRVIAEETYDIVAGGEAALRREMSGQRLTARESPLTLELERGAFIEGRVVWSDGTPVNVDGMIRTESNRSITTHIKDGAFTLRNIPPGKVSVVAELGPPSFAASDVVELTAPASGVTIQVPRGGRLEGTVVDRETEKPVREFAIFPLRKDARGSMRGFAAKRFAEGRFVLEDLAPGNYDIRVSAAGYSRMNSAAVTIEDSKTAKLTIQIDRGGAVIGRVTAEGRAIAEVQVRVKVARDTGMIGPPGRTDANGDFKVDDLPEGSHVLDVRRDGFIPVEMPVNVSIGKETRADVDLSRGRELHGRVIDEAGVPVANAEIMSRASTSGLPPPAPGATTDVNGAFKLSSLGDKTYTISAQKPGYVEGKVTANPATVSMVTITLTRGGSISGRIVGLSPAEMSLVTVHAFGPTVIRSQEQPDASGAFTLTGVPDGDITVHASLRDSRRQVRARVKVTNGVAPPVDLDFSAGFTVRGRVTARGKVVEGSITFRGQPTANPDYVTGDIGRDGTYEVHVAARGEYRVSVNRRSDSGMHDAGAVNVSGDMVHDIDLRGGSVSGVVKDAETRLPVANARVLLIPRGEAQTDGAGRFTFDLVTPGDYELRVWREGYAPEPRAFSVGAGGAPDLEVMLSRGVAVTFTVIDAATGQPVTGALVSVGTGTKYPLYFEQIRSDVNGITRLTLSPGTYELKVGANEYPMKTVTLMVPGPPLTVKLERQAKR